MFPILNPPPSSLPIPSLWAVPVHQPQASSIVHRTWTGNSEGGKIWENGIETCKISCMKWVASPGLWLCCSKRVSLSYFFIKQKCCYQYRDWICHGSVFKSEVISTLVFFNLYNHVPKKVCIIVLQDPFFLGCAGSSLWCVGSPVVAWGLWDLSSLTRDQSCVPCIERQILSL